MDTARTDGGALNCVIVGAGAAGAPLAHIAGHPIDDGERPEPWTLEQAAHVLSGIPDQDDRSLIAARKGDREQDIQGE